MWGKLESDCACLGKGSVKTFEDIECTHQAEPWHTGYPK